MLFWEKQSTALKITSFSPTQGEVGTVVTVNGSNFLSNINQCTINNVFQDITILSDSQLSITIAATTTNGKITINNGTETVSSETNFIVTIPPTPPPTNSEIAEIAQDAIRDAIDNGTQTGIAVSYNDPANGLSFTNLVTQYTDELAQDATANALNAGTHQDIIVTYNNPANSLSFTNTLRDTTNTFARAQIVTPKFWAIVGSPPYTVTLNTNESQMFHGGTSQNFTFAFSNVTGGKTWVIEIENVNGGSKTISWPSSVRWPGNVAPTLPIAAGGKMLIQLTCVTAGMIWGFY